MIFKRDENKERGRGRDTRDRVREGKKGEIREKERETMGKRKIKKRVNFKRDRGRE